MGVGYLDCVMPIVSISPRKALEMQQAGAALIDVREIDEHALGIPVNALRASLAKLQQAPHTFVQPGQIILLICKSGKRSQIAAEHLLSHGYSRLHNVDGGFDQWIAEQLPIEIPADNDTDFIERYARHLRLPQVGMEGQKQLENAKVLLVGAGGLGSPIAFYLAAAGVGQITIIDNDIVDKSNLQRQILHTESDIGIAKVDSAANSLQALNSRIKLIPQREKLDITNVHALVQAADVVIDGSDNFPTRYLISDTCVQLAKPMIYAAVERFHGQISVFDAGRQRGIKPCYRCLFPEAPTGEDAPNCAEAGVFGVLPGVMGVLQATETIKLILNIGDSLAGRLLQFDALAMHFTELGIPVDPSCKACGAA
jgi:sulfur-carrier protein adenylyltransferase/sulfurtransferase